jgi:hypothetical protein
MYANIEHFKLPIEYIKNKNKVDETIVDDLELIKSKEQDVKSIYEITFNPNNIFSKSTTGLWSNFFTDNTLFLKDSQTLIKTFSPIREHKLGDALFERVNVTFNEIMNDTGFYERYQYIDTSWFKHFNNNSKILQMLSMYNLTSPAVSLILPIIFLIIPFFILKVSKINIDMQTYLNVLKHVISKHPLGNVFNNFSEVPLDKKFYISLSIAFYFFQLYQNFMACRRFYVNLKKIHDDIFLMREYLDYTILQMDNFEIYSKNLQRYSEFVEELKEKREVLSDYKRELCLVNEWKLKISKMTNIGHVMKCFYQLYSDPILKNALTYSFGFNGYVDNVYNLTLKLKGKVIGLCKFSRKNTSFKDAYYPAVIKNAVKNTYNINKQLLITGPNAAGKTTFIKTTFFNILISQQIGLGFYSKAKIFPYHYLHCYLNIPDTSGRDSLFQAEARRCKKILDSIQLHENKRHFCIFDELYSGTNPYEAISSSVSFLKYLNKYTNFTYILTTHYLEVCKLLDKEKMIKNCHMNIVRENDNFKYTYKLEVGISEIKGGVKVLSELNYPDEIIEHAKKLIV